MLPVYVFCTILGGGLLLLGVLGSMVEGDGALDGLGDASEGLDLDVSVGVWKEALSFRTLAYGVAVFGAAGWVLTALGTSASLTALLAVASALGVSAIVAAVMGYVQASESGFTRGEEQFVGAPGRLMIPFSAQTGIGEVSLRHDGRVLSLRARAHGSTAADARDWRYVVVVAMNEGVADVAPLTDGEAVQMGLLEPPEGPRLPGPER